MKQTVKFFTIIVLSAVVAAVVAMGVLIVTDSGKAFFCAYFGTAMLLTLAIGAFNIKERARYDSIKYRKGIQKAA